MDLTLKNQRFIVGGVSSGFGRAVAEALLAEGATVIGIARSQNKLDQMKAQYGSSFETIAADLTKEGSIDLIQKELNGRPLAGIFINAGGPPTGTFAELSMEQWDAAYQNILRWKVDLVRRFLPAMQEAGYGRLLFLESVSVKQPIANLMLSNSLRMAVVGMVKTLSQEIGPDNITANILAPGYHATAAMDRIFARMSHEQGITTGEAKEKLASGVPVKKIGEASDLASLAVWLLSPLSHYITGQTITVDGGLVSGAFG